MEQAEAVRKMALIDLLKRGCHKPSICKKKKKEEEEAQKQNICLAQ